MSFTSQPKIKEKRKETAKRLEERRKSSIAYCYLMLLRGFSVFAQSLRLIYFTL
jgi:hypothetical protein